MVSEIYFFNFDQFFLSILTKNDGNDAYLFLSFWLNVMGIVDGLQTKFIGIPTEYRLTEYRLIFIYIFLIYILLLCCKIIFQFNSIQASLRPDWLHGIGVETP